MTEKGVPKRDGSGRGKRLNKGRGGCSQEEQEQRENQKTNRRGRRNRR